MTNKFEYITRITKKEEVILNNSCSQMDANYVKRKRLFGYDNLIGENSFFDITTDNLRESVTSSKSRASNRFRQVVCSIATLNNMDKLSSLEEILVAKYKNKRILLLEHNSVFASVFIFYCKKHDIELITSEYFGHQHVSGDEVAEILNVDIQQTHFPDNHFDLILHNDVFEHVPDAIKAEKEQVRILKQDGHVVFTVPFDIYGLEDNIYAELHDGLITHYKPPIYHEDPISEDGKCLVFRIFTFDDMLSRFKKLNCEFYCDYLHSNYLGILGNNAFTFVVKKNG